MTMRLCEWCGTECRQATCGPAHRAHRWRYLRGLGDEPWAGSPLHGRRGELSQATAEVVAGEARLEGERNAARAAAERAQAALAAATAPGPRSGSNARSGVQVSYRKAVEVVARELFRRELVNPCTEDGCKMVAEVWLRDALSESQRAKAVNAGARA